MKTVDNVLIVPGMELWFYLYGEIVRDKALKFEKSEDTWFVKFRVYCIPVNKCYSSREALVCDRLITDSEILEFLRRDGISISQFQNRTIINCGEVTNFRGSNVVEAAKLAIKHLRSIL